MLRPTLLIVTLALVVSACSDPPGDPSPGDDPRPTATTSAPTAAASDGPSTTAATTTSAPPGTAPDGETVPVLDVLDGDSLAVERNGARVEVRLAGINTPERDECYGDEARRVTEDLVAGGEVVLVDVGGEDDEDQYGRLLRNVWLGGTWINGTLVVEGAALALQTGSDDEDVLITAEDAAWEQGLGLWGTAVCGEFPSGVVITDIRYDPPGRDFENTTEEWVLIGNEGDESVDLGGWTVRDESSTHRYRFPDGLVLAPGDGVRLRSGCGADEGRDLYWCAEDAVWSNGGDTVLLQTDTGTVVDRWKYTGDF